MFANIDWVSNHFRSDTLPQESSYFSAEETKKALHFHSGIPGYQATPLHSLRGLAQYLGINSLYVKDESKRFSLNAFKSLGASYAIASYYSKKLKIDLNSIHFNELVELVKSAPSATFATATDGNHGKGLAWAASLFGQKAKVYMPKGSSPARLEAIKHLGADAYITDLNYDDTVQMAADLSEKHHWILVQDTAWEGYQQIPLSIMQGYTTIIAEIYKQNEDFFNTISHVILQAGVGSFAASMAASLLNVKSGNKPKISIVEPESANCLYQSAQSASGSPVRVYGDLSTMMAGLACGEPNPFGWNILRTSSDYFFSCNDKISALGMRILGNPIDSDPKIISGESGSVPLGLLHELSRNTSMEQIKKKLELDQSSNVLIINTEGDTDPENYRKAVWGTDH